MAIIEGRNPIIEALKNNRSIEKIMVNKASKEGSIKKILAMAKENKVIIQEVDRHKLDEMSESHAHQGVIAITSDYRYYDLDEILEIPKERGEDPFFIILDGITDPHNLGSIIRTADAVGAHAVIIPKRRSVQITPIVAKASAGAVEYLPVCKVTNIVNTIKTLKETKSVAPTVITNTVQRRANRLLRSGKWCMTRRLNPLSAISRLFSAKKSFRSLSLSISVITVSF